MINFFKKNIQKRDQQGEGVQQANTRARHSAPLIKREDKSLGANGAQLKQSKTGK